MKRYARRERGECLDRNVESGSDGGQGLQCVSSCETHVCVFSLGILVITAAVILSISFSCFNFLPLALPVRPICCHRPLAVVGDFFVAVTDPGRGITMHI